MKKLKRTLKAWEKAINKALRRAQNKKSLK